MLSYLTIAPKPLRPVRRLASRYLAASDSGAFAHRSLPRPSDASRKSADAS
ncbi:MAG: hypothetical protein LBQ12_11915 [Deltaproteobacteria bacterium]|nr:hypothetical protein [Deltaproteobacteria bacterium]